MALLLVLVACNNESSSSKTGKTNPGDPAAANNQAANQPAENSGGCASLMLFHKGAVIQGKSYDGSGNEVSSATTTIKDVRSEGNMTVADATMQSTGKTTGEHTMTASYKCDGENMYIDMNSMMQNFKMLKDADMKFDGLAFPVKISAGQKLPDASVEMEMGKMKMKTSYKNRIVGAAEKITTPAGTWDCFKISSDIVTEMPGLSEDVRKMMEKAGKSTTTQMTIWYAPGIGPLKTELYIGGKLTSRSEITAVKE